MSAEKERKKIETEKENIRKEIREYMRGRHPSFRGEKSRIIQDKLISGEYFLSAAVVMSYVALPDEVDTEYVNRKVLESGRRLAVPYVDTEKKQIVASEIRSVEDLIKGPYGIYVPKNGRASEVNLEEIDLVLVPGLAFDRSNRRLGRGEGYYDRFLAGPGFSSVVFVGLAFRFQIRDNLPHGPHDRPVHTVITD